MKKRVKNNPTLVRDDTGAILETDLTEFKKYKEKIRRDRKVLEMCEKFDKILYTLDNLEKRIAKLEERK